MAKSLSRNRIAIMVCTLSLACSGQAANAAAFESALTQLNAAWQSLMSAISVKTGQVAASSNQVAATAVKSAEANANAIAQVSARLAVADAATAYGLGRDQSNAACAPVLARQMANAAAERNSQIESLVTESDADFLSSNSDAAQVQSELARRRASYYCSEEEYAAGLCSSFAGVGDTTGAASGDTNASVFMDGGANGAEEVAVGLDYLDRVAPLPTVPPKSGAASAIARIISLREAATKSMAREVLSGSIVEGLE
jgi:hypothetical protein